LLCGKNEINDNFLVKNLYKIKTTLVMDKKMVKIFSGSSNLELAKKVVKNLNMNLGDIDIKKFSDEEKLPIFKENLRGRTVFIIQSCYGTSDNYFELFQMIHTCKLASASKIIPIIVYYGYSRQDRKDQPRVGITSKMIANFLESAGATRVVSIDLHADQIAGFFNIPVDQLYASYMFVPYIKNLKLENCIVASPDTGGTKKAKYLSGHLNTEMVICYKHRTEANKIDEMILIGDVKGKDVIIVDDIADTCNTICRSADLMMEKGAKSVRAFITHPVMSGEAYSNIEKSKLTSLIVTDTIPLTQNSKKITVLSVDKLLSTAIKNIVDNKSLSKLFI
jgi:ribose-phosphate pyrophosphokinase